MEQIVTEILQIVKNKMKEQGAYDRPSFHSYIEETIEELKSQGIITDDDNDELIEDKALSQWPEVEEWLSK